MSKAECKVRIIGVGNPYRGDDGAGIAVARILRSRLPSHVDVIEQNGEGTSLAESWKGVGLVIVVDAGQSGAPPGTIRRFDAQSDGIPIEIFGRSTHNFGVASAIELGRALGELPSRLVIYAIEGRDFSPGGKLTPPVERGVREASEKILLEVLQAGESDITLFSAAEHFAL